MTEEIERRIGPYRLVGILGRGGTSTVYEAVDMRDGRRAALKVVTIPTDPQEEDTLTRRMERAGRAVASLNHPNIARVYETGEAPLSDAPAGAPHARYIAMELIDGITLRERLKREAGPLSLAQAADILSQTASGLDAVHDAGVLHRDVKPSNILLGADGTVKLTDFGIARRANDTMVTLDGVMIGSPHYISPEQTTNQPSGPSSDLWSLGVVLYEMVVGKVPYAGENIPATLYQIAHGSRPEVPLHFPPAVREVLSRALERDPSRRFSSATALAEAFRAALAPGQTNVVVAERMQYSSSKRSSVAPLALAVVVGMAFVAGGFLAAPRFTDKSSSGTSTAVSMEGGPVVPSTQTAERPKTSTATLKVEKKPAVIASKASPSGTATPVVPATPLQVPTAVVTIPAPLTVTETTPKPEQKTAASLPTTSVVVSAAKPQAERRRRVPTIMAPVQPPVEISNDPPPLPLEPSPKATPKPTLVAAPESATATPSPTPIPTPNPTVAASTDKADKNEEGTEAADPNTRLIGVWHGSHTGHSAQLVLGKPNRDNGKFRGTLTVQMPSGPVRIAIAGRVFDDGGVIIEEKKVVRTSEDRAWDLGVNTGTFDPEDLTLSGDGKDKKGRTYQWSFHR